MKLPATLRKQQGKYHNMADEFIYDFTGYREVPVRSACQTYAGQPNACIDNSVEFADYGDLTVVQGYFRIGDAKLGAFHYWNQCPETGVYWDCSPVSDITYWIKDTQ
jgi:hypothetical protein